MTAFRYWSSTLFKQDRSQSAANAETIEKIAARATKREEIRMKCILLDKLLLDSIPGSLAIFHPVPLLRSHFPLCKAGCYSGPRTLTCLSLFC